MNFHHHYQLQEAQIWKTDPFTSSSREMRGQASNGERVGKREPLFNTAS